MSTTTSLPPQIVMVGDSARTRRSDPVTSHEAADSTTNSIHFSQVYVYDTLRWHGPFADHELVEFHEDEAAHAPYNVPQKYSASRLRSARAELVEQGRVVFTGEFVLTDSGRRAKVWRAVSS